MRFNILPSHSHLRFSQIGPVLVFILVAMLPIACFNKAIAEPKNKLPVIQEQPKETVNVSSRTTSKKETQKREAWMEAGQYAKAIPVVAISVSGHAKDATAQQIGEYLKTQLASAGIPGVYFTGKQERLGAAVTFFLKDMAYGPTGVSGIQKNLNTVLVHFSQAWPEYKVSVPTPTDDNIK